MLCGGRLVLGVGTGWNPVGYEALGQDFHTRSKRMDEQIRLLRMLCAEPLVTFEGEWDRVTQAGLNPLPLRRDIPIWMGGSDRRAIDRAGRLGDGWFPLGLEREPLTAGARRMRAAAESEGRDPTALGLQCGVREIADPAAQVAVAREFAALGATHAALFAANTGLTTPRQHIDAITRFAEALKSD